MGLRRGWSAVALALAALPSCAQEQPAVIDGDPAYVYEEFEIGPVSVTVAEPGPGEVFEYLMALALAPDRQSVYALDIYAPRVHRLDLDGTVLASMGRRGAGPGELESPSSIKAVPEGVWVLDSDNARATLFAPDGSVLEMVGRDDVETVLFSPFAPVTGGLIVPGFASPFGRAGDGPLLSIVSLSGESREVGIVGEAPEVLAESGIFDRISSWVMAPVSGEQVAIVLRNSDMAGWTASLSGSPPQAAFDPLPIPQGIVDFVRDARPADLPDDMRQMVVMGVRLVDGKLWIMTPGLGHDGLFGFTVPEHPGDTVSLVYPGALVEQLAESGEWVTDAVVVGDRVVALHATGIVLAELRPRAATPEN